MENSIEEDIELLQNETSSLGLFFKCKGSEKYKIALEHILSDYKRVLKENEELKNNIRKNENELEFDVNCDWIALQKILDESKKSNEYISYKNEKWIKEKYCIPVQKIKDKIEEYKNILKTCNKAKDIDRIKAINERVLELEELLEKDK